jgi:hypothetical protein
MLCVIILISMYYNSNLFCMLYFKFLYNCFFKFIIYKINFGMVKSEMVNKDRRRLMLIWLWCELITVN